MASKRRAANDLNHDNWDKEEEPEDPGNFRVASGEELKNRVIKKARRTITSESSQNSPSSSNNAKNIFSGFSGFAPNSTTPTPTAKASPFAFLSKLPTATSSSTSNTITTTSIATKVPSFSFGSSEDKTNKTISSNQKDKDDNDYASKIIKLNKSFCDWIMKHVNEQPLCNLSPTFKDYEKYFQSIQQESKQVQGKNVSKPEPTVPITTQSISNTVTSSTSSTSFFNNFIFNQTSPATKSSGFGTTATATSSVEDTDVTKKNSNVGDIVKANPSGFSFDIKTTEKSNGSSTASPEANSNQTKPENSNGSSTVSAVANSHQSKANGASIVETSKPTEFSFGAPLNTQSKAQAPSGFSFGLKTEPPKIGTSTGFSFGVKKDDVPTSTGFSFTSGSTPFTFTNIKPPVAEPPKVGNADGNEDEDDEPPKVEIKEIVEEDAIYTKRCKVFVKKDNAFKDCGIGTFYLKPVKDSGKTQLLVRSSNNLGTILVNVILAEGMPTQRMGKNNVMLVHPGSAEDPKPQTTLLRVKDGVEADELHDMINKHKK